MPSHRYPIVAKEGWGILLLICLIALYVVYATGMVYSIPVWLILLGFIYLYRDPYRVVPSSPLAVISPVGGVVESVNKIDDRWLGREGVSVRIRMDFHSSYSIRSPIEGKVSKTWCSEPDGMASEEKLHRQTFCLRSDEGDEVVLSIGVNKLGSRLKCYAHPGERIGQGQRCGYFFLGGVVDVILPSGTRIGVHEGDRVISGSSILGQLTHPKRETTQGLTRPILT